MSTALHTPSAAPPVRALSAPEANSAEAASLTRQLLRMGVGSEVLAVPIRDVHEILEVGRMTGLPRTPEFVRGVMNLRGSVVPVIDLSTLLGLGHTEASRRNCVVVVEVRTESAPAHAEAQAAAEPAEEVASYGRFMVGLLVQAVHEVFDVEPAAIEPVPALGTVIAPEWLNGMTRSRGTIVGILAPERALAPQLLAQLIAAGSSAAAMH